MSNLARSAERCVVAAALLLACREGNGHGGPGSSESGAGGAEPGSVEGGAPSGGAAPQGGTHTSSAGASEGGSAAGSDGTAEGGAAAEGGTPAEGGAGGSAGAADCSTASGCSFGEKLFEPECDAQGGALFALDGRLYWSYECEGVSFIATGSAEGGAAETLVKSAEPIELFDVRGALTYTVAGELFVFTPATATIVDLGDATECIALTSTTTHAYCRTDDGRILGWPATGGPASLVLSGQPGGTELVADPLANQLLFDFGALDAGGRYVGSFVQYLIDEPAAGELRLYDVSRAIRVVPGSLRLWPNDGRMYWFSEQSPGLQRAMLGYRPYARQGQNEGELPSALESYKTPLLTPIPIAGIVLAITEPNGGAQLMSSDESVKMNLRSREGVVGLASDDRHIYWLDRKSRVFRDSVPWPDVGEEDNFSSSLDARRVSELTDAEIRTYCQELRDAAPVLTDPEAILASCVRSYFDAGHFPECSRLVDICVAERSQADDSSELSEADCVARTTAARSSCDATVASFSACAARSAESLSAWTSWLDARAPQDGLSACALAGSGNGPGEFLLDESAACHWREQHCP